MERGQGEHGVRLRWAYRASVAVLVASLWTLTVLARPLAGWELGLVSTMAALAGVVVAVPALGHGIFLLDPTPARILIAAAFGVAGALAVEATQHIGNSSSAVRRR